MIYFQLGSWKKMQQEAPENRDKKYLKYIHSRVTDGVNVSILDWGKTTLSRV